MKTYTTEQVLQDKIKHKHFWSVPGTFTTVCTIVLDNGFTITKAASCNNPHNYNEAVGRELAFQKCVGQANEHYGFLALEEAMDICASCGELKCYADMCFTTTNYICQECDKELMKKEKREEV